MNDLPLGECLTFWGLSAFIALWVLALGANLGSFLNVVVYRMPRGMPLALSVSRCPKCANPIAVRDNIPILSWLLLRGRCRSCGQAISARYPLVESAVGGLFLLLYLVELLSGGRNLPLRPPSPAGFMGLLVSTHWDLVGIFLAHACLLYLLLAVALIQADRRLVPWELVVIGIVCGVAAAPFQLLTVVGSLSPLWMATSVRTRPAIYEVHWQSFAAAAAGMACGAAWGVLHALVNRPESARRRAAAGRAWPVALGLAGLFLGWQGVTSIALATCIFRAVEWSLALVWPSMGRVSATAYVLTASIVQVVTWRWNDQLPFWPGHHTSPIVLGSVCIAGAAAALTLVLGARARLSNHWTPG